MNVRRLLTGSVPGAVLGLLLSLPAVSAADSPYPQGEIIEITGAVTDAAGNPQPGRTVVLEAYRRAFDLSSLNPRQFGRTKKGLVERSTITGADGRYLLQWPWHDYFNRFELSVGAFTAGGLEVAEKVDLSRRILRGSPVIISFILGDGTVATASAIPTASPGTVVADGSSAAQHSLRDREGEPDVVDTLDLPIGREVTWWYFTTGRAYRFLDGELRDELTFDPVRAN